MRVNVLASMPICAVETGERERERENQDGEPKKSMHQLVWQAKEKCYDL
jgi:hypothetical protein